MPAIGIPPGSQPRSDVSPHGPEESTIVGSTSRGTRSSAHMRSSQSTLERLRHSVREALLASVACTRPRVSFHSSHVSTVPKRGRVHATARQLPQQPRVDGTEGQLAARGASARVGHLVEDPRDLRPREVGVEHEAGALAHHRLVAVGAQPVTDGGGAAALPDDRAMDRRAGGTVPDGRRLALVGDADGGDVVAGDAGRLQRLGRGPLDRRPEILGVVLHPARPRIVLRDLGVAARPDGARDVDDERRRAGRSLVEREHEAAGHGSGRLSYGLVEGGARDATRSKTPPRVARARDRGRGRAAEPRGARRPDDLGGALLARSDLVRSGRDVRNHHAVRGAVRAARRNAATRIEAFVASGGTYVYGSYPDIDGLFREQATELDRKRREATLHRI